MNRVLPSTVLTCCADNDYVCTSSTNIPPSKLGGFRSISLASWEYANLVLVEQNELRECLINPDSNNQPALHQGYDIQIISKRIPIIMPKKIIFESRKSRKASPNDRDTEITNLNLVRNDRRLETTKMNLTIGMWPIIQPSRRRGGRGSKQTTFKHGGTRSNLDNSLQEESKDTGFLELSHFERITIPLLADRYDISWSACQPPDHYEDHDHHDIHYCRNA